MPVELRPLGVVCNIGCHYCYQQPQRDAANHTRKYHLSAMKAAIEAEGTSFTLFGGEPLLVPEADLEDLWAWGFERHGRNGVQTNGVLINDNHIRMFKRYKVAVGISMDGPGELNDVRWAGSLESTRAATGKTEAAIRRLCAEGLHPSLIITLHRGNATADKLARLTAWIEEMDSLGIRAVRLHILEVDHPAVRERYELSIEENIAAFLHFAEAEKRLRSIRFDVFRDMRNMLIGKDNESTCIWTGCDPYTTAAVRGVEGNGQRSNCGRTNKEGVDFVKSDSPGFERYLALYHTPQEHGGCQGCRYFLMCKGQCPGTAIDGDWRNRSEHCLVWKALFEHFEKEIETEGKEQILSDETRAKVEALLIERWRAGRSAKMAGVKSEIDRPIGEAARGLPRFARTMWVSDRAREAWEGKITAFAEAWRQIEWMTVVDTVRPCASFWLSQRELAALAPMLQSHGIRAVPLLWKENRDRGDVRYRVAVGRPRNLRHFRKAWKRGDDDAIGALLGYPVCCRAFFRQVFVRDGLTDAIWPMAAGAAHPAINGPVAEVSGPPELNPFWRALGLQLAPHFTCRFDCSESISLAGAFARCGRGHGLGGDIDNALEMLRWPVEWSALHGIAEIRTPVLKVSRNTDATHDKRIVRHAGTSFPDEGARGMSFALKPIGQMTSLRVLTH